MLGHPMSSLDAGLEKKIDQVKVTTGMGVPIFVHLHTKGDGSWQRIGTRGLTSRIPGLVIGSKGLTSDNAMRESTTSEVLVVLKGHGDDDEDSNWTTNFFYLPRSRAIPKVV